MLKEQILKLLNRTYEPLVMTEMRSGRYDLAIKTDGDGRPILLFIGQKDANGRIKGERYARRTVVDKQGNVLKDHWDNKGAATAKF